MTNDHTPETTPSINIPLMIKNHAAKEIARTKASILRLERQIQDERAELETLVRHAAIAGISVEEALTDA